MKRVVLAAVVLLAGCGGVQMDRLTYLNGGGSVEFVGARDFMTNVNLAVVKDKDGKIIGEVPGTGMTAAGTMADIGSGAAVGSGVAMGLTHINMPSINIP